MATDRFLIELDAEGDLVRALDSALRRVEAPDELMDAIGAVLESNINTRFITKQDPMGLEWAPLAEETLTRKRGRGSTLIHTGQGRDSLTRNAGRDWVEVGFGDPKMVYHETGTKRNGKPAVPRRGMLTADPEGGRLGDDDRADVEAEITRFLSGAFGS